MWKEAVIVFIGSGLGGVVRLALSRSIVSTNFPWATLCANVLACFILGTTIALSENKGIISPTIRLFLTVGFCGGFSTFSTFSNETLQLINMGNYNAATINVMLSLVLCIGSTFLGMLLGSKLF